MMRTADIRSRDPFILPHVSTQTYYLYAAANLNAADGKTLGFDCFTSRDLEHWQGPFPVFRPAEDFWATRDYWAPEVHAYRGRYYLFATLKASQRYRGTQVFVADAPDGPFVPLTDGPVTPPHWECLDGTLFVDPAGVPWIVFCHEWVQVHNGGMWAMPLTEDLAAASGRPIFLFSASEAPWKGHAVWPDADDWRRFPTYVTDGPFLHRTPQGTLLMLWSTFADGDYALGIARSASGRIEGPWLHDETPLYTRDGGHAMLFYTFDGRLMIALHAPNRPPDERAHLLEIEESEHNLHLKPPSVVAGGAVFAHRPTSPAAHPQPSGHVKLR